MASELLNGCLCILFCSQVIKASPHMLTAQPVYVDCSKGTQDKTCWNGGLDLPCNSLDLAMEGAELQNTTVMVLGPGGCKHQCQSCSDATYTQRNSKMNRITSSADKCPPWFIPTGNASNPCKCAKTPGDVVSCDQTLNETLLLSCNCMSYEFENTSSELIVGSCMYGCFFNDMTNLAKGLYFKLPQNISNLNAAVCGPLNRTGRLCGQCAQNLFPPVYSYDIRCVNCSNTQYNGIKYAVVAFLPLTALYLFVIIFRISISSAHFYIFVQVSQAMGTPALVRVILANIRICHTPAGAVATAQILLAIYGIWNLDFFRTLIPPICLEVNTLQAIAIDYCAAFYPLLLIGMTYLFIKLHECGFHPVVWVWMPIQHCLARFRLQCNLRSSLVEAFATFLLLSYVKLLDVSVDLLMPITTFDIHGKREIKYLFYDATIEVFSKQHFPYAILASIVLIVFIFLPLLFLMLYPLRCFQKCLNHCQMNYEVLRIFADAFQGTYKNGTEGTHDYRYFAAGCLVMRIVIYFIYALVFSGNFFLITALALIGFAVSIAFTQPHKVAFHNTTDIVLILILAMWFIALRLFALTRFQIFTKLYVAIILLLSILPLVYISGVLFYWIYTQSEFLQRLFHRNAAGEVEYPDRLINPGEYEQLLQEPAAVESETEEEQP